MRITEYFLGNFGPPLLLIFIMIAVIYFFYSIFKKFSIFLMMKPIKRWDRIFERLKGVIIFVFFQKRLFKDPLPGIMHFLIFWGFLILLVRAITLFGMGFFEGFHLPLMKGGVIEAAYDSIKDTFVLLVIIAVIYALFRRVILKTKRLVLSFEANLILVFIVVICITDLLLTASLFLLNEDISPYSYAGIWVSRFMYGWDDLSIKVVASVSYWVHLLTILVFLNLLPHSKHFHIITSIPNVFLRSLEPRGSGLEPIDFDNTEQETFGVSRMEEFKWKDALDSMTCTQCGRCSVNCPANLSEKPLKPMEILINLRHYFEDFKKRGDLFGSAIKEESLWSCTTCLNCEEECPVFNEYMTKIIGMRQYLVMMESRFPSELKRVFKGIETGGNPWGMGANRRFDWADGMEVPIIAEKGGAEYLFFVGCAGSFDDRCRKVTKSIVSLLSRAKVDFAVLGTEETCCGDVARRTGNEYLFYTQAKSLIETFKNAGVKKIIVSCPHGFNTFKNEYPGLGGNFEVYHHSQIILDLINSGKIDLPSRSSERVVFHDSCYLGRGNGIYDEPRRVIQKVITSLIEPDRTKEKGLCCGGGGGWAFREEKGKRMNYLRVEELVRKEPDIIAVECPFCLIMLEDGIKALNLDEKVRVKDLSELLGGSLV